MIPIVRKIFRRADQHQDGAAERYIGAPPHGQILVLDLTGSTSKPRGDAVSDRLMKFAGRPTPFVGVLIDIGDADYQFPAETSGASLERLLRGKGDGSLHVPSLSGVRRRRH